jgi:hypothetical protein
MSMLFEIFIYLFLGILICAQLYMQAPDKISSIKNTGFTPYSFKTNDFTKNGGY